MNTTLISTTSVIWQIDTNCSPFQFLNMLPFYISLEHLKLICQVSSCFKSHLAHFPAQAQKNKKNYPRKKFLIFQEMELSSFNIKKILIFLKMKPCTFWPQGLPFFPKMIFICFSYKNLLRKSFLCFLIFPEMKNRTFQSKQEK